MDARRSASLPSILRAPLASAIAFLVLAGVPNPVVAECDGPVPSFRDALATAKRVVIGDVTTVRDGGLVEATGSDGWSSRFTLRVRYTPVGSAPRTLDVRDLPTQPCAGVVQAREGDRIALAFDATDYTPPIQVNTVAWIRGTPWDFVGVETITTAEVFRRLGLTPPDTSTLAKPRAPALPTGLPIAVGAGMLAAGLVWRRGRLVR